MSLQDENGHDGWIHAEILGEDFDEPSPSRVPDDLPFGWEPGEVTDDGSMEIGAPLSFEPDSDAAFDETVAHIIRASRVEANRTGFKLDVTLFVVPDDDELSEFVVFSVDPDDPECSAVLLVEEDHLGPQGGGELLLGGWKRIDLGNYVKSWPAEVAVADIVAPVTALARRLFDPDGRACWLLGVTPLVQDPSDPECLMVAGEAAPEIARRAIATIHGAIPDDPSARQAACDDLGFDVHEVFGA